MITEEINKIADKRKEIKQILQMIDVVLPKEYYIEETSDSLSIVEGKIFKGIVANLRLIGDVIEVNFTDEKDLEKLRNYFDKENYPNTKFKLIVGEEGYY